MLSTHVVVLWLIQCMLLLLQSKEYGPCTLLRLRQLKKQLQEDTDRNKVRFIRTC